MKSIILLLSFSAFGITLSAQYFCDPCSCDSDYLNFQKAGDCPSCGMTFLKKGEYNDTEPAISPDGRYLVYNSTRNEAHNLYRLDLQSGKEMLLTESRYKDHLACWSQKGDRLVYTSYEGKNAEIFIMLPDGRYDMRLTYEPAWDGAPSFSNDGSKIAFVSRRTGKSALFVMNSDGTQPTMVTEENVFFFQPQWSADDEWLIFPTRNDRDQPWEVHRIKVDGTSREKTDLPFFNGVPANHEGKFIFSERTDDGEQIFMMNADSSGKKQLTHTPGKRNSQPVWSPDGKKVYFTSNREGLNRIYALDMASGEEKRISQ